MDHEASATTSGRGGWSQLAVFISNRRQQVVLLLFWLAANIALFVYKYEYYTKQPEYIITGPCICIAKGAAEAIKLNMALILLPVSRLLCTFFRNKIGTFLSFDHTIVFHQLLALGVLFWTLLHVLMHLSCDYPRMAGANHKVFLMLLGSQFDDTQPSYWGFLATRTSITGFLTLGIMLVAFPLAAPFFRRAKFKNCILRHLVGFNTFWYSHMLLLLMFPLLIFHGSRRPIGKYPTTSTWLWLVTPMVIYSLDRLVRFVRVRLHAKQVDCIKAETFADNVLSLTMRKPPGFDYRAGQYIFLQCPQVSRFEWHPYSLTSAPSDDVLQVHIRTVGDWTSTLHETFREVANTSQSATKSPDLEAGCTSSPCVYPRLLIDGPYGAPAQDFYKFKVVMLIGAGIGLTPYASVMRECHHHMARNARQAATPASSDVFSKKKAPSLKSDMLARVQKVYLYWATKDREALVWFQQHLSDFAGQAPSQSLVELNGYLTRQSKENESTPLPSEEVTSSIQEIEDDGVQMSTSMGRPNWDEVFLKARSRHPNTKIGVFFCGPPKLSNQLCQLCCKYTGNGVHFQYFKETF